jgi:hypothetical protein
MTEASWETADLNRPIYAADLIISALSRTPDNPAVNIIGQREMTAREMSEMVSRYSQALASKGLTQGNQSPGSSFQHGSESSECNPVNAVAPDGFGR